MQGFCFTIRRIVLFSLLFLYLPLENTFGQSYLEVSELSDEINLNPYARILQDESRLLRYEDVLARDDEFIDFPEDDYLFKSASVYWAKFKIEYQYTEVSEWMFYPDWEAEPRHNCFEEIYIKRGNEVERKETGRYLPASRKDVKEKTGNKVRLKLTPGESIEIYAKFYKTNHEAPRFNPRLVEIKHWQTYNNEGRNLREGIFQGMLWIMILYALVTFLVTQNKGYLMYLLFLLATSVFFLYMSGMFAEFFGQEYPKLTHYAWIISSNILPYAYLQFGRSFINSPRLIPKADRYVKYFLRGILVYMGIELLISILTFNSVLINRMVNFAFLLEAVLLLGMMIYFFRSSSLSARIFIYGSLFLVAAAIVGVFADLFFNLRNILPFIEIAFFAQMLAFSFGLAERMRRKEQQKFDAERKMNEELLKADKLKDAFLANTSHELRTPLHGIIGLTENLYEKNLEKDHKQSLAMIIRSAKRPTNLVNDLMDFSKLQTSDLSLHKKPLDISTLAEVVVRICEPLIGSKSLQIQNNIYKNTPAVFADEGRTEQIFINILSNAIKFTEKGFITINAKSAGDNVLISVSDTGIGIAPDKLNSIFTAFEQGDGSASREYSGTGLGLSISKKLIELQGGELWAESEPGVGSTFYFTIPISSEKVETSIPAEEKVQLTPLKSFDSEDDVKFLNDSNSDGKKILIVDDEAINQQVLINHLSGGNYKILTAMNGEEAIEKLNSEENLDMVLLDIMMPRMSGYEVCQRIRDKFGPSELPIIMITAKNQVADLVQGLSFGANDYLAKPFSKAEFLARVLTHLHLSNIQSATDRFVPRRFIESLGSDSILDVALGDHIEETVTVFFSDIRSYTSLAEKMTPSDNFKFVNAYAGRMGPIISKNRGFVHQYLGDGIMAIFKHAPIDSLKAAIDMQEAIRIYNVERNKRGRRNLKVGMGMHTGKLIMGIIGDQSRTDAGTISDTVNTAARMEGLTKVYGSRILLSESSYSGLSQEEKAKYTFRYLGPVKVKGKEKAIDIYECLEGESPEERDKKFANLWTFQEGLDFYFKHEFEHAAVSFRKILKENAGDAAAKRYLAQSVKYMLEGVEGDLVDKDVK